MRFPTCALFVILFFAASATAQRTSALINEALDKQVKLDLKTTLPQALEIIESETGVRIVVAPAVWELLPWGEETSFTAKIENQTLRQALQAITRKLGLDFALKDEYIELQPLPALRRLGRRSTVQEIQALDMLASTPIQLQSNVGTVKALLSAIDQQLVEMKSTHVVENRAGDAISDATVRVPRNATLLQGLESIVNQSAGTWYPWGESLVIVSRTDQIRNQLNKALTARFEGVDISQVLLELSQQAGVEFSIEPGALQRIAPEARNVRLLLDNASIRQALENIAGFTGLGYVINDRGVYLWNQSSTPGTGNAGSPAATGTRDPVIGTIEMGDGLEIFLPSSQVPPDVRDYFDHVRRQHIEAIRERMKAENFTAAATQPAGD